MTVAVVAESAIIAGGESWVTKADNAIGDAVAGFITLRRAGDGEACTVAVVMDGGATVAPPRADVCPRPPRADLPPRRRRRPMSEFAASANSGIGAS